MKRYLITGASGGIGSEIARVIAENEKENCLLILHHNTNFESVRKLKRELESDKIQVECVQANLENKSDLERLVHFVFDVAGGGWTC